MINNYKLLETLNSLLQTTKYKDYCPSGLQIEGCSQISNIIVGVSLSEKLIDIAIKNNAGAIIVHHGIFWHKDSQALLGSKKRKIEKLIRHNINLYAYHLPLDNHSIYGNNIQLANLLGIKVKSQTGEQDLLWLGEIDTNIVEFSALIAQKLQRLPVYFAPKPDIKSIAWCTGAAQNLFGLAISLGVDAFLTGEVSEPMMSIAEENNTIFISAGHYATERYGIMALAKYIQQNLGINSQFIELYNPI